MNGVTPKNIRKRRQPKPQTSEALDAEEPDKISGAVYDKADWDKPSKLKSMEVLIENKSEDRSFSSRAYEKSKYFMFPQPSKKI